MAGVELNGAPHFLVGSTVNSGASGGALDMEIAELDRKITAGAKFFVTPPVFDLESFSTFMKKAAGREAKIIPTVLLLKSVGMARYIDRHLDNVTVPSAVISRIQKAQDKVRECVDIAAELVSGLRKMGCNGVLIVPLGWEHKLLDILDGAKA